jgi:hypothetical protein
MADNNDNQGHQALSVIKMITNLGIGGAGPLISAVDLAEAYQKTSYDTKQDRIDAMIRWESSKTAASGFVTGVPGIAAILVTLPASLVASWAVQARLAAAIAAIHGYDPDDDRVQTLIMLCLLGDAGKELAKDAGILIGTKFAAATLKRIPGRIFIEINKKVGFRLITKAGEKGVINLTKWIPLVGGVIGGSVDGVATYTVGHTADAIFGS